MKRRKFIAGSVALAAAPFLPAIPVEAGEEVPLAAAVASSTDYWTGGYSFASRIYLANVGGVLEIVREAISEEEFYAKVDEYAS